MSRVMSLALGLGLLMADASRAAPIKGEAESVHPAIKFKFMGAADGGEVGLRFKVRYRLEQFWGEPLRMYTPYYEIGDTLTLRGRNGVEVTFKRSSGNKLRYQEPPVGDLGGIIEVPSAIYDKIALWRYQARLKFAIWAGPEVETELNDEGLLTRNKQWGWDVPGSPNWSEMFIGHPVDSAKRIFKQLQDAAGTGNQPSGSLRVSSVDVDVSTFRYEVSKQLPGAFEPLYRRTLDSQARSLIDAAVEKLRATTGGSIAADLERRRGITDRFFAQFGARLDSSLSEEWSQVKKAIESTPQIEKRIRELKSQADRGNPSDKARLDARELVKIDAVRRQLVPRSSLRLLEAAVSRIGRDPMRQSAEFHLVVVQTRTRWVKRKKLYKGLNLVSGHDVIETVGASRVLTVPFVAAPEFSSRPQAGRLSLDRILSKEQLEKMGSWQRGLGESRDFQLNCFGSEAEAEQYLIGLSTGTIYLASPPDLTR